MPSIRAFIAVDIDDKTKQKISELISNLKKSGADAKWITEGQTHLTLKFMGNIDENGVQKISDIISDISNDFEPFKINFSGIGGFPNLNHPSVIWLGIENGSEHLKRLNGAVETALEKIGFKKGDRPFKPHLTLARIRSDKNIRNLIKSIGEMNSDLDLKNTVEIDKLTLFQSVLNPKGAIYKIIAEKYLRKTY